MAIVQRGPEFNPANLKSPPIGEEEIESVEPIDFENYLLERQTRGRVKILAMAFGAASIALLAVVGVKSQNVAVAIENQPPATTTQPDNRNQATPSGFAIDTPQPVIAPISTAESAIASPTIPPTATRPAATATLEPTPTSKSLHRYLSQEKNKFTLWQGQEVQKQQQDALSNGEGQKLPLPQNAIENGGQVVEIAYSETETDLLIILPPGKEMAMPALVSGEVVDARRSNASANIVSIKEGDQIRVYDSPRTSTILVKKGDVVEVGTILFNVKNNPDDPIQQAFEKDGFGVPKGTIVLIGLQNATTGEFLKIPLENLLRAKDGSFVTIPTASPAESAIPRQYKGVLAEAAKKWSSEVVAEAVKNKPQI